MWSGDRFSVSWRIVLTVVYRARQSKKNSWLSFAIFLGLLDLWPFKMKAVCSFDVQEPLALWHSVAEPSASPLCEPPVWWLPYCLGALTSTIQCQWAVVSDRVMLALLYLCVNTDAGNLILHCMRPHHTVWKHYGWSSVCIWGDRWLGCGHYAGFSGLRPSAVTMQEWNKARFPAWQSFVASCKTERRTRCTLVPFRRRWL
jgi:hypothetical protein